MTTLRHTVLQLCRFAWQQALSCLFPILLFLTFGLTRFIVVPGLHRYDLILLICLAIQAMMYKTGLETRDELKVIAVFHLIGLLLEIFKTHMHSWAYPEPGWTKIYGVPLYSGFMYASVASYLCQAWRRLDVHLLHWPCSTLVLCLAVGIYLNFFTEHILPDMRWALTAGIVIVFRRTWVHYAVHGFSYRMPMCAGFFLIGFFLWVAENIATYFGAWQYPDQHGLWHPVHLSKMSSWSLLVILSFLIVAQLKRAKESGRRWPIHAVNCRVERQPGNWDHMAEVAADAPAPIGHLQGKRNTERTSLLQHIATGNVKDNAVALDTAHSIHQSAIMGVRGNLRHGRRRGSRDYRQPAVVAKLRERE